MGAGAGDCVEQNSKTPRIYSDSHGLSINNVKDSSGFGLGRIR